MENKCADHDQPIVGFNNQQKRSVCLQCLAEFQGNVVLNEDANFLIKKFKEWFQEQYKSQFQKCLETVKQFTKQLYDLKTFLIQVIDKLMSNLNIWEKSMFESKENHEKSVHNINDLNFEVFIQNVNEQQVDQQEKFKKLIYEQAKKLMIKKRIEDCFSHLKQILKQSMTIKYDRQYLIEMQQQLIKYPQVLFIFIQKFNQVKIKCKEHDSDVIMLNLNTNLPKEKRLFCAICVEQQKLPQKYISIENAQKQQKQSDDVTKACYIRYQKKQTKKVEQIIENFQKLKFDNDSTIENVLCIINQQYSSISKKINQTLSQLGKDWSQMTEIDLIDMAEFLSIPISENSIQQEISEKIQNIEEEMIDSAVISVIVNLPENQFVQLNNIFQFLQASTQRKYKLDLEAKKINSQKVEENYKPQPTVQKLIIEQNDDLSQTFQLINGSNQQQTQKCFCLQFNKENNLLAVGCGNDIKIFTFQNATLNLIQLIQAHNSLIKSICFDQNNSIFSCSGGDKQIKIWTKQTDQQLWIFQTELLEHEDSVLYIILNKKENMLISGSCDKSIKCWIKNGDQWKCQQTLKFHNSNVNLLVLNESDKQLLSCGRDKKLNIFEFGLDNQWQLKQSINIDFFGFRASFIGDNIFVIQSSQIKSQNIVQIYEKKDDPQNFVYDMKIEACSTDFFWQQSFYPYIGCDFKKLKFIKEKENPQLSLEEIKQTVTKNIKFRCNSVFGVLTDEGEYLITWDSEYNQIQIRQRLLY